MKDMLAGLPQYQEMREKVRPMFDVYDPVLISASA
jgi:hypothetical protein